jgi:hypothetical protein
MMGRPRPPLWRSSSGALEMVEQLATERQPTGAGQHAPAGMPRGMVVLCILLSAFGVLMMVVSGANMLEGDFTASGSGRSRSVSPLLAFLIGLGIALSPIAIRWQELGLGPFSTQRVEHWGPTLFLRPEGLYIPEEFHGREGEIFRQSPWGDVTPGLLEKVPAAARPVVQHYRDHPEHLHELGTEDAVARAGALGRSA